MLAAGQLKAACSPDLAKLRRLFDVGSDEFAGLVTS
jgi:hypothetical protein